MKLTARGFRGEILAQFGKVSYETSGISGKGVVTIVDVDPIFNATVLKRWIKTVEDRPFTAVYRGGRMEINEAKQSDNGYNR